MSGTLIDLAEHKAWEVSAHNYAEIQSMPVEGSQINNAHAICERAAELVRGDRERTHGDKVENHSNIAELWSAWLRIKGYLGESQSVSPHDVAIMMALLKCARTAAGSHNADDYVDMAGYAGVSGEIAEREARER